MPTTATQIYTGVKLEPFMEPDLARTVAAKFPASLNIPRGTVVGELTATPGTYKPYASGNSDGSQIPKGITMFDMQTDASGNITFSSVASTSGDEWGYKATNAPVYITGYFRTTELTGLDANAITVLGARFVSGVLADGVVAF